VRVHLAPRSSRINQVASRKCSGRLWGAEVPGELISRGRQSTASLAQLAALGATSHELKAYAAFQRGPRHPMKATSRVDTPTDQTSHAPERNDRA
jgi:hypothetical protein